MSGKSLAEYQLELQNIMSLTQSGYSGITLLYVLKGQIKVESEAYCSVLHVNDVLLINKHHYYQIIGEEDNIVLRLEISANYFSRYYKDFFYYSYLLRPEQNTGFKKQFVDKIQSLLAKILVAYIRGYNESYLLEINRYLSDVLLILVLHFKERSSAASKQNASYSKRIEHVIDFVETHYNQNISLKDAAKAEFISFSYLSRLFKKEVGISFIQYLTQVKFSHGIHDLINTSKPIYQIAQDNGFTTTRQFIELFKQAYDKTPNQFRREKEQGLTTSLSISNNNYHDHNVEERSEIKPVNSAEVLSLVMNSINSQPVDIEPDDYYPKEEQYIKLETFSQKKQPIENRNYIVVVGKLDELLKAYVQEQVLMVQERIGLSRVEAYHLISGDTILPEQRSDEVVPSSSPYNNTDIAISFLKQHDIALQVRIYHHNMMVDLPAYIQKLSKFIQHNINVFGLMYVQRWRFIYYPETKQIADESRFQEGFFILKDIVKSWLPESQVGAFYHFSSDEDILKKEPFFTSPLAKVIDFLGYSANSNEQVNFTQFSGKSFANSETYIQEKTQNIIKQLKLHDLNVPLELLTWNTLTGNTRHTNGSFFRGALLFNTLVELPPQVEDVGLWINTETQNELLNDAMIDVSSLALYFIHNTKRPIFHVLTLKKRLQGQLIAKGQNYMITKTYFGYQIVLTNAVTFNPYLSIKEHLVQSFKKRNKLIIQGLKSGQYQIKKFTFDQQNGALYRQFEIMQTRYGRDPEIIEHINRQSMPSLKVYDEYIHQNWSILNELDINAIHFYELHAVY